MTNWMIVEKNKGQKILTGIYTSRRSAEFIVGLCRKKRPASKFVIVRTNNHATDTRGSVEKWLQMQDNLKSSKSNKELVHG
jgi:hypothetical protein